MNPARTFGPAAYGGYWHTLWIYFIAPTVGMLAAAETFLRIRRGRPKNSLMRSPVPISRLSVVEYGVRRCLYTWDNV
jgi:hypothetical protein